MPAGYSRHYYDLYQLAESHVASNALADLKMLADVVAFKQRFYRSTWAQYELAKPGTFRLLPTANGSQELQKDYKSMQPMFFKTPPSWDVIMTRLESLEVEINRLETSG